MIIDDFKGFSYGLDSPARDGFEITPDDSADLPYVTRAIYVGREGAVRVTMVSGSVITLSNVPAGTLLPLRVTRVHVTATTALDLIALQ